MALIIYNEHPGHFIKFKMSPIKTFIKFEPGPLSFLINDNQLPWKLSVLKQAKMA